MTIISIPIKSFLLFLMLFIYSGTYAQEKEPTQESGIVMTSAELESFIQRVASLKKARIEKQQKEQILRELELAVSREVAASSAQTERIKQTASAVPVTPQASPSATPHSIQTDRSNAELSKNEMAELNARIDLLMRMMETMRLQLNESEYRREVLSCGGDYPLQNRISEYNRDPYYPVAPGYEQRQQIDEGGSQPEPYGAEAPAARQRYAEEPDSVISSTEGEVVPPDTIYVLQSETGYETVVSPGVTGLQPLNVTRRSDTRRRQATQQERVRVVQAPPQTIYLDRGRNRNQQPVVIYRDQRDSRPAQQTQAPDSTQLRAEHQQLATERKIDELQTEISLLRELMSGSEKSEEQKYIDDINRLNMQISALTSEQETRKAKEDDIIPEAQKEQVKTDSVDKKSVLSAGFAVYFANNSIEIPVNDYARLKEIANEMKDNPDFLVLLRGFASSVGNAAYNQKIAGQRAASVQKWLVQNGVAPDKIITQGQGADTSRQEDRARRVEITLLSK